ncbi:MAG: hypothetical protein J6V97_09230 [Prevotella sp.]|nr:hypothetical protein [Prevotella sp.]
MKKQYMKPTMMVAEIQQTSMICGSNEIKSTNGNAGLGYEGAGDGTEDHGGAPRSRQHNVWDEDEEE